MLAGLERLRCLFVVHLAGSCDHYHVDLGIGDSRVVVGHVTNKAILLGELGGGVGQPADDCVEDYIFLVLQGLGMNVGDTSVAGEAEVHV